MEGNEVYITYISYRIPMIESVIVGYCHKFTTEKGCSTAYRLIAGIKVSKD